ncbi:MAG TPA: hypothetical protein PLX83_07055 [bacterium]|mgnify:FL=1|nr:hypothetical protein [bacterium]HXK93511.1 hypothetical protein [bacterium]
MTRKATQGILIIFVLALMASSGWTQGTTGKHVTITTRAASEFALDFAANTQGAAPGDIAMQILLQDNGISARVVPDKSFYDPAVLGDIWEDMDTGETHTVDLVILSGSSGSSDVPDVQPLFQQEIPIMMGEHVCLAEEGRPGSIKMYQGTSTGHGELRNNEIRQIKIVNKEHPITQGIATDAEGFVQVFRDPYPSEGLFTGWFNTVPKQIIARDGLYENRLALGSVTDKAAGTVILAEIPIEYAPSESMRACLAVIEKGALLADGTPAPARMVHWMSNEEGSGGPHRNFLALNATGRTLFIRACRWAMGMEDVTAVVNSSLY